MAQTSEELQAALRLLKARSRSEEKAYGFVIIPAADDGVPAMYIAKNETKARNEAKLELKTAKKKQMIVGKVFWDNNKLSIIPTKRVIKPAVIKRLFKKMYKKHSSGLGGLGGALKKEANLMKQETESVEEESKESQVSQSPKKIAAKCMKYIQKVKELYEDLIAKHADTEEMFSEAVQQQGVADPALISKIASLVDKLEVIAKGFPKIEEKIDAREGKVYKVKKNKIDDFKKEMQDFAAELGKKEKSIDELIQQYQTLAFGNLGKNQDITTASRVETLLLLAKAQKSKLETTVNALKSNQVEVEKKGSEMLKVFKEFIGKLGFAQKNEDLGTLSDTEFKSLDKKWKELARSSLELMLEAKGALPSKAKKTETELKQVLLSSRMELQRFISSVLAHPIIKADFQYHLIEQKLRNKSLEWTYVEITEKNKRKFSNIFKAANTELYRFAKSVEGDTTFGTFKPITIIKTYIKSI